MKYMLLIHSGGTAWARFNSLGEEEQAQIVGEYRDRRGARRVGWSPAVSG
jgi:hypothetical protein